MNTFKTFWMVLGSGQPVFHHLTKESAMTEAERLAREYPGNTFTVLQAIGRCKKVEIAWQAADEEAEEMRDIPF